MGATKVWAGETNATVRSCVLLGDKTIFGGDEEGLLILEGNTCLIGIGVGSKEMESWEKSMDPEVFKKLHLV